MAGTPSFRTSGCAQWWPGANGDAFPVQELRNVMGMDVTQGEGKDAAATGRAAVQCDARQTRAGIRAAYAASSSSHAAIAGKPEGVQVVDGGAQATAPSTFGVPASNFQGRSFQVDFSSETDRIISPPPIQGGMASRSFSLPYRAPMPIGP